MDYWYVKIEKVSGKVLYCHFYDNHGYSKHCYVWSNRLLKKMLKKHSTLKLVDNEPQWVINGVEIKEYKFEGFTR